MKYPAICKFTTLLYCLLVLTQSTIAQLCAGSWALQRPLTSQCVVGQWIGWQNSGSPLNCPAAPVYTGVQTNTFNFSQAVNSFLIDFRVFDGVPGCPRIEIQVNDIFYPLSPTNLLPFPVGSTCTSGSFSNLMVTSDGYISVSSDGAPGLGGQGRIIINQANSMSVTISTNDGSGSVFSNPFSCSDIIPLTLENFSGVSLVTCRAKLEWTSGIEQNVQEISLEKSSDNFYFQEIAQVSPRGSNSNYSVEVEQFEDAYYRLKIIDIDESYKFSEVLFLKTKCNQTTPRIYPNPTQNFIKISHILRGDHVRILDMQGRLISNFWELQLNGNLDISGLAPSMYILQIIRQGKILENLKLLKN